MWPRTMASWPSRSETASLLVIIGKCTFALNILVGDSYKCCIVKPASEAFEENFDLEHFCQDDLPVCVGPIHSLDLSLHHAREQRLHDEGYPEL